SSDLALAWRVAPGAARLLGRIKIVVNSRYLARTTCRLLVQRIDPRIHLRVAIIAICLVVGKLLESGLFGSLGDGAVGVNDPAVGGRGSGRRWPVLVAQQLVPHYFVARFRYREG